MKAATCSLAALLALSNAAAAQEAEVMHWWTSSAEAEALQTLANAYQKAGGTWVDRPVPDFDTALATATSSIINGTAPAAIQFNAGSTFTELAASGMLTDLTAQAEADGWADKLSPAMKGLISYEGAIYALPVDVQNQLWVFTSTAAYEKAGIAPPESWEEFMESLDALTAAGVIPVAQGGEGWQDIMTFESTLLFSGKADLFKALFVDTDIEALKSDRFLAAAQDFKKISTHLDAGSAGRKWNDATAMVISGQAAVNFMGDWALPAFAEAGQTPGKEFECNLGFGDNLHHVAVADVFVLPKNKAKAEAQTLFARTVMSPETQEAFNLAKGSLSPRLDVSFKPENACSQKAIAFLSGGGDQVITPASTLNADRYGAYADAISQALHTPNVTAEQLVQNLIAAIQATEY